MPGDGVGAGVEAFAGELGAQGDDEVDGGLGKSGGAGVRSSGAGFEGGVAVEGVAGGHPRYPALGDPVIARDLRLAAAFDEYGGDDQAGFRHPWKSGGSAIPMS